MNNNFPICTKPWTTLEVRRTDGGVKCCCWLKLYLGNVRTKSIFDIWNSEDYQFVRKKMLEGDLDEICRYNCQVLHAPMNSFYIMKHQSYPVISSNQAEFINNRKLNIKEIIEGQTVLSSLPSRIMLHPSNRCNLHCVMCRQQDKGKEGDLNDTVYKEVKSLYPVLEELKFVGGEPLFCKVSQNFIFKFDSNKFPNCRIALITNGTLFTQKNIDRLLRVNIGWIEISLDAATRITYEKIRQGALWTHTLNGIEKLIHSCNTRGKHFPIILSMVVQKRNYNEIPAFVDLGYRLGVHIVFVWVHSSDELIGYEDDIEKPILEGLERAYLLGYTSAIIALARLIENKSRYFKELKPKKDLKCRLREIDKSLFNSRLSISYHSLKDVSRNLLHFD